MNQFLMGAVAMAYWVAGLFFLRFWKRTRERLFAIFAVSFWLLALTRIALVAYGQPKEGTTPIYLVRFLAYVLIVVAILDKNREQRSSLKE